MTHSAVYVGQVFHARHAEHAHAFRYPMSMLYLDLDELAAMNSSAWLGIEAARPLSFRRKDYLGDPTQPLKQAVAREVHSALGFELTGPIRLLTQVRAFGYSFNPVSFYYCFDADGLTLRAVVAEITNTPWGERHRYVIEGGKGGARRCFDKAFHVSPFMPMTQRYDWTFSVPDARLSVAMLNLEAETSVFRADLTLERKPLCARELSRMALQLLPLGWGVHAAIYLQALRLKLKGAPFFQHPRLNVDSPRLNVDPQEMP